MISLGIDPNSFECPLPPPPVVPIVLPEKQQQKLEFLVKHWMQPAREITIGMYTVKLPKNDAWGVYLPRAYMPAETTLIMSSVAAYNMKDLPLIQYYVLHGD